MDEEAKGMVKDWNVEKRANPYKIIAIILAGMLILGYVIIPEYNEWKSSKDIDTLSSVQVSDFDVICDVARHQQNPWIYQDIIVWTDYRNGNADIYGYDLETETEFVIDQTTYHETIRYFNDGIVAYSRAIGTGNLELWIYEVATNNRALVVTDSMVTLASVTSEFVIYSKLSTLGFRTHLYNISDQTTRTIDLAELEGNTQVTSARGDWCSIVKSLSTNGSRANYTLYLFNMKTYALRDLGLVSGFASNFFTDNYSNVYLAKSEDEYILKEFNASTGITTVLDDVSNKVFTIRGAHRQYVVGYVGAEYEDNISIFDLVENEYVVIPVNTSYNYGWSIYDDRVVYHARSFNDGVYNDIYMITLSRLADEEEPTPTEKVSKDIKEIAEEISKNPLLMILIIIVAVVLSYIGYKYYSSKRRGGKDK